jgi:polysaccharide export outer membrane protein
MNCKKTLAIGLCSVLLVGCSAPKKVVYLKDAETIPQELLDRVNSIPDPTLTAGDLLNIRVYGQNYTAVAPFNKGQYTTLLADGTVQVQNSMSSNSSNLSGEGAEKSTDYYLVDTNGDIEFPILGTIHVAGKTKEALSDEIRDAIYPKYVTTAPTVEIRLMNFKVTVLGQVGHPGVLTSSNERMNILEAIAKAGDLGIQGSRDNIMLYRTNSDGTHLITRLNIHDKDLLLSPYFNLQQNDFIYVEPNRSARQNAWQMHQGWTTTISIVGGISSLAALVVGIINLADD